MAQKITVQVRVCPLGNVLGFKLTLQLLWSHCGVHLGLPFAGGTCCVSVLSTALAPFASFPSGLEDFNNPLGTGAFRSCITSFPYLANLTHP